MSLLRFFKSLWPSAPSPSPSAYAVDPEQFIYVKIPGDMGPVDRGEMFEDRIDTALAAKSIGSVSGGGSSLGDARADGSRPIVFCGIDIDTHAREETRALLRTLLPTLDAPAGTELHYTKNGRKLQDTFTHMGWALEQRRVFLHPGFGV